MNVPVLLSSVGCSIFASTVFAFLYKSKTDDYVEHKLLNDVKTHMEQNIKNLFEQNRLLLNEYPAKVFQATKMPNPEFNTLIDSQISTSSFYKFKGARAMFLAYRLKKQNFKKV